MKLANEHTQHWIGLEHKCWSSALRPLLYYSRPTCRPKYTYHTAVVYWDYSLIRCRHITQSISKYPRPILTYFTGLVGVLVGMIFHIFVWRWPKGRCYGDQLNLGDVRKRRVKRPLLFASALDNGLADCKSAFKFFIGNNQATSHPNLVNYHPIISEFTLLKRAVFAAT